MQDHYGRTIDYLRISITDRCNLRCRYCMPNGIEKVPMSRILTYEQILLVAEACTKLGITKFKVTGGEPLVRKGCVGFVRRLKALPGVEQVTMTTNGMLLAKHASALRDAGLDAVNVSLDTADPVHFREITGGGDLQEVLSGIRAAKEAGIRVKLNTVLLSGPIGKDRMEILSFARDDGLDVRFIELMPIGFGKALSGGNGEEFLEELKKKYPGMEPDLRVHGNGPARYYRIPGFQGSVGFISALHGRFCAQCNRIRLTSQGLLKPCLCYGETVDLREILKDVDRPEETEKKELLARLMREIARAIREKPAQHCFGEAGSVTELRGMNQIGG